MNADRESELAPGTRAPRTQGERRAQAERSLLDAAVQLIAERGIERFTLAEVGLRAGYSSGLPAHYFGRKDALVAAVARTITERFGDDLERHLVLKPGLDGLLATAAFYLDSAAADPQTARALSVLLGESLHRPDLLAEIARINRLGTAELERQLAYGIEQGRIRADLDVPSEAVLILAGLRGTIAQWLADPEGLRIEALRDAFLANLRQSLAA